MQNKVIPYEGKAEFCFVSYCHKDIPIVFQIMEELAQWECRIWYDVGIPIGSEFSEEIAEHLKKSEVFLAFLSYAYMRSDFCRAELNYALEEKKKMILVYLEEVTLTPGFDMRLKMIQSIFLHQLKNANEVSNIIMDAKIIGSCMGNLVIDVSKEKSSAKKPEDKDIQLETSWEGRDAYFFSIRILEKAKDVNDPELKKVLYELKKINGFLRNDSDFGEGSIQVQQCEQLIQMELENIQKEIDTIYNTIYNSEDKSAAIQRILNSCRKVTMELKIRIERKKK